MIRTTARSWALPATLGFLLTSACSAAPAPGDVTPRDEEALGEVASPLPKCDEGSTAPICNPTEPVCKPRCTGKACGGPDGCGGACRTGTCSGFLDLCGGGGVPAQCGHVVGDLRPWQTGFRDQGGRDTCTVFATTAAVEAAYKRKYRLSLDLSEQYFNHMQKSHWLDFNAMLPKPEIQPEANGGGNIEWQFGVLARYGLPRESTLPYIGSWDYQNVGGWLSPSPTLLATDQHALDDFMLGSTPTLLQIPFPLTTTVLPQAALEDARYRPTSTRVASYSERRTLAWFKTELAAGREVAFDVGLTSWPPAAGSVWSPGASYIGHHAMLMVGYDDAQQVFFVKNSWANTTFDLFSYSWVTGGHIAGAATVIDVADPNTPFGTFENKQLALGRWNLDFDGWRGELDLYRLPGDGSPLATDRRMGTYFGPDGVARRVNGTIDGNRLDFYIDWGVPNMSATVLGQGMHFITYLYGNEKTAMAGEMISTDASRWVVTAQKGRWLDGIPRSPAVLSRAAYSGRWELDTDGIRGTLAISATAGGQISGSFTTSTGTIVNVSGATTADPRIFSFVIVDGAQSTSYSGYLNGHELGIMAGVATKAGVPVGFHAVRQSDL